MAKETEVKFEVDDFENVYSWLEMLGAQLVWGGAEINIYLDTVEGALKKNGRVFRLREWEGCSVKLTVKGNPEKGDRKFMVRDEYQVDVDDLEKTVEMFKYLGFIEALRYKKEREHWVFQNRDAIELDTLEDGRRFVEIEAPKERIERIAHAFGLDWSKSTTKSYPELLEEIKVNV